MTTFQSTVKPTWVKLLDPRPSGHQPMGQGMNNKLAATMIAIGSVIAAQFAASAANYVSHELFYSGKGLDEGAAFSASIVGALTWVAVFGFGLNWAYKTFKGPKH